MCFLITGIVWFHITSNMHTKYTEECVLAYSSTAATRSTLAPGSQPMMRHTVCVCGVAVHLQLRIYVHLHMHEHTPQIHIRHNNNTSSTSSFSYPPPSHMSVRQP